MDSPVSTAADPLVGRLLDGRYRLAEALARGGMATVYTGTDTRLDRTVAVKVMHRALADDPAFVARFTREAKAAARLSSPDVVAVHDQGTDPETGLAYLVMEHVQGSDLRSLLREQGAQPPARALALVEPVLRALAAAHAAGLVHRDVKPENVLLGRDGRVQVVDFGLARAVEASALTMTTGVLLGTAAYLAPEQVRGDADDRGPDPRSDVYSTGILLWELLVGRPPYTGGNPLSLAYRHLHEDVPPPSTVVAGLPRSLDDLVVRATRRDPSARPVDAGAFLAELRAVRDDLPRPAPRQATLLASSTAPPERPAPAGPGARARPAALPGSAVGGEHSAAPGVALGGSTALPQEAGAGQARRSLRTRRRRRLVAALAAVVVVLPLGAWGVLWRDVAVPPVIGTPRDAAVERLEAAGLTVTEQPARHDETVPAGRVVAQDPPAGGDASRGDAVRLVLSRGPDRRPLPDLVGLTQAEALAAIRRAGLRPGAVTEEFSARPIGEVLRMGARVGTRLRPGSPVTLVVSRGVELLPVPRVVGEPLERAREQLREAGFLSTTGERVFSESVAAGSVAVQEPAGGRAPRGGTVRLQLSRGPRLVEVPDLTDRPREEAVAALRALGLRVAVDALPFGPGKVRGLQPSAGTAVRKESVVTVFVF